MLWIWRFFMGYLTIKICRSNGEKILNRAAARGINIWNLYYKNGYIYGNISARNFIKLYSIRHDIKCKIKILRKHGIFFKIIKHKNRVGFLTGMIIFVLLLFFLNNFIWIINVEGNHYISSSQIIDSCNEIGIYEGIPKNKIKNKYAAQRLQLVQKGIAWCSFNIEGCVLTVNLSEIESFNDNNLNTPSNIKSLIEGKIKKIDVTSGNVLVSVDDFVSKGELLVSGIIENIAGTIFVRSNGEIIAETKRVFSSQGDFIQKNEIKTDKIIKHYTIDFFSKKIPLYLGKIKKPYKYKYDVIQLKILSKNIPIKILYEEYIPTIKKIKNYDINTLEENLYKDICKQVENFNFINSYETSRELVTTDKGLLLKINYICEENIAVQDDILINKEN